MSKELETMDPSQYPLQEEKFSRLRQAAERNFTRFKEASSDFRSDAGKAP